VKLAMTMVDVGTKQFAKSIVDELELKLELD
jgi:hypothetical protein